MHDPALGAFFILSWFLGALPLGHWLGRLLIVEKLHELAQTSQITFWRVVGPRRAIPILGLDVAKGLLVPLLGAVVHLSDVTIGIATACVAIGHVRSPLLGWRASKGTNVILGAVFGLTPLAGLLAILVWLLIVRVSQSLPFALMSAVTIVLALTPISEHSLPVTIFTLSAALFLVVAYRVELRRYVEGRGFATDLFRGEFSAGLNKKERAGSRIPVYSLSNGGAALGRLKEPAGGAVNWGFVAHLLDRRQLERFNQTVKIDWKKVGDDELERFKKLGRLTVIGEGMLEAEGRETYGAVLALAFEPWEFADPERLPEIREAIERAIKYLRRAGCEMIGLGGLTSPAVEAGDWLEARDLGPVTSGNALTAGSLVDAMHGACRWMGVDLKKAVVTVIGASGSVGRPATEYVVSESRLRKIILTARTAASLQTLKSRLQRELRKRHKELPDCVEYSTDVRAAIEEADVIVSAVSTPLGEALATAWLKPGAIFIDASVPTNLTEELLAARPDVLFLQGGIYQFPGVITCAEEMAAGIGDNLAYACTLETMVRALLGQNESAGIGLQVTFEEMQNMRAATRRFGCRLAGFRVLGRRISILQILLKRLAAFAVRLRSSSSRPVAGPTQIKV